MFHHDLIRSLRKSIYFVVVTLVVPQMREQDLPLFLGLDIGVLSQCHAVVELELDVVVGMGRGRIDGQESSSELDFAVSMLCFEILTAEGGHLNAQLG